MSELPLAPSVELAGLVFAQAHLNDDRELLAGRRPRLLALTGLIFGIFGPYENGELRGKVQDAEGRYKKPRQPLLKLTGLEGLQGGATAQSGGWKSGRRSKLSTAARRLFKLGITSGAP